jgi:hypothetical protein
VQPSCAAGRFAGGGRSATHPRCARSPLRPRTRADRERRRFARRTAAVRFGLSPPPAPPARLLRTRRDPGRSPTTTRIAAKVHRQTIFDRLLRVLWPSLAPRLFFAGNVRQGEIGKIVGEVARFLERTAQRDTGRHMFDRRIDFPRALVPRCRDLPARPPRRPETRSLSRRRGRIGQGPSRAAHHRAADARSSRSLDWRRKYAARGRFRKMHSSVRSRPAPRRKVPGFAAASARLLANVEQRHLQFGGRAGLERTRHEIDSIAARDTQMTLRPKRRLDLDVIASLIRWCVKT